MILIFGHACNHNLMRQPHDYYNLLERYSRGQLGREFHFALCDFTNPSCKPEVDRDFGYTLPTVEYTPWTGLTPAEHWNIQQGFDFNETWEDIPSHKRIDPDGYYYKTLYTPIRNLLTIDEWYAVVSKL